MTTEQEIGMMRRARSDAVDRSKKLALSEAVIVIEAVDHPAHYGGKDDLYEAIKIIEALGFNFNLGSCFKYLARAGKKDPTKLVEDLKKAAFYLNREIENQSKAR